VFEDVMCEANKSIRAAAAAAVSQTRGEKNIAEMTLSCDRTVVVL